MKISIFALQLLLIFQIQIIYSTSVNAKFDVPRLNGFGRNLAESEIDKDLETFYYNQTLDHFNYLPESYKKFQQRYVINSKYFGGANSNAPIFAYLGLEAPLDNAAIMAVGFLRENAPQFKALQVYIEHRYYGKSIPFGSREEAFKNASTLGYFNSAQALADYAEILIHVKEKFNAKDSPTIVIGGSYGGMLASWFRLKYPHLALGALASSAPVLYLDDITPQDGYTSVVTKVYKEASKSCHDTIKSSWAEIDRIASKRKGLAILDKKFKTCKPLTNATELKDYLKLEVFSSAAQNDSPQAPLIKIACELVDRTSPGNDILMRISNAAAAITTLTSGGKIPPCFVNPPNKSEAEVGWGWQASSDIVMPIADSNDTMFQPGLYKLEDCKKKYGVPARPHWATTYYGGHDIKLVLKRFGSNIIFTNGLRDPWSIGGVLENISDSIVAVNTMEGSHCMDLHPSNKDPQWLIQQKQTVIKTIKSWLTQYYSDLQAYSTGKSF